MIDRDWILQQILAERQKHASAACQSAGSRTQTCADAKAKAAPIAAHVADTIETVLKYRDGVQIIGQGAPRRQALDAVAKSAAKMLRQLEATDVRSTAAAMERGCGSLGADPAAEAADAVAPGEDFPPMPFSRPPYRLHEQLLTRLRIAAAGYAALAEEVAVRPQGRSRRPDPTILAVERMMKIWPWISGREPNLGTNNDGFLAFTERMLGQPLDLKPGSLRHAADRILQDREKGGATSARRPRAKTT